MPQSKSTTEIVNILLTFLLACFNLIDWIFLLPLSCNATHLFIVFAIFGRFPLHSVLSVYEQIAQKRFDCNVNSSINQSVYPFITRNQQTVLYIEQHEPIKNIW